MSYYGQGYYPYAPAPAYYYPPPPPQQQQLAYPPRPTYFDQARFAPASPYYPDDRRLSPYPPDNTRRSPYPEFRGRTPPRRIISPPPRLPPSPQRSRGGRNRRKQQQRRSPSFEPHFDEDAWLKEDTHRELALQARYTGGMAAGQIEQLPAGMEDFYTIRLDLSFMTVDKLKGTIRSINQRVHVGPNNIRLSGNKGELVERIREQMEHAMRDKNLPLYQSLRQCCVDNGLPGNGNAAPRPQPVPPPMPQYSVPPPQPGPSRPQTVSPNRGAGPSGSAAPNMPINFRFSPFFRPESVVMSRIDLPVASQGDRRTFTNNISLSADQKSKLMTAKISPSNAQYQIRLYCTTDIYFSTYYANHGTSSHPRGPAPIEFPAACEIKLNYQSIGTNKLRGIKKKEGSTCPPDLTGYVDLAQNRPTRLEVVYVNTDRRYFVIAYLVEVTSVETLVERVKKGKFRSKDDVIAGIRKSAQDDEISATSSELSLKDPLTFARITTPARGTHCQHLQSFELSVYLMANEQTPTWECPICSNRVAFDELIIDGYMGDILKNTSKDVDSVIIEADGAWKLEVKSRSESAPKRGGSKAPADEDDFSDDDLIISKETRAPTVRASIPINLDGTSPATSPRPPGRTSHQPSVFIDLTASDDEDSAPAPMRNGFSGSASPFAVPAPAAGQKRQGSDLYEADARGAPRQRW